MAAALFLFVAALGIRAGARACRGGTAVERRGAGAAGTWTGGGSAHGEHGQGEGRIPWWPACCRGGDDVLWLAAAHFARSRGLQAVGRLAVGA
jgi:hypothetical protein